jgi:pyruvate,water dikinase
LVEETVVIRHDPGDGLSLGGQILAAPRTDPGWVPLFPSISGLLVERGSLLSHSAVVAREMGIPTIVGIRGITQMLEDGERIRMDGRAGTVERLLEQGEE